MKRAEVYRIVDTERDYQDLEVDEDPKRRELSHHSVGDYITMLNGYQTKVVAAWIDNAGTDAALDTIRKIAAIAIKCMEEHGAKPRIIG